MRWRNTLILLVILAILAAYVYFIESKKEIPTTSKKTPTPQVININAADVVTFEIHTEESTTRLVREKGEPWRLEKPVKKEADDEKVNRVLDRITTLTARRAITETTESLESFGLAEPQMEVTLILADGREQKLLVGEQTPQRSAYYVQKPGDATIYLVQTGIIADLQRFVNIPPVKPTPTPTWTPSPTAGTTPTITPTPTG